MDAQHLSGVPLFASLSHRELTELGRFTDEVDLEPGRELVKEGDCAYEFFAIEDGSAEVRRGADHVADLGPGDFFGEMGVMAHLPRNASVVTTAPTTAIVMTGPQFRELARSAPPVAQTIESAIKERTEALPI
jgi:CRP-like cAMP-binding protein